MGTNRKKIGILTGGGDCPGLNAVIRAAGKTLLRTGDYEILGIKDGFSGLLEKRVLNLSFESLSGIMHLGGTIIGTSNKANPFHYKDKITNQYRDFSKETVEYAKDLGMEALICVGGDGTQDIAYKFQAFGIPVIGVPKTIDNDLMATDLTFGFDTAVAIVAEAMDRLHTTARSHHRVMILEVMGRNAGWIALHGGMAGGADVILIPEIPYRIEKIAEICNRRNHRDEGNTLIIVSEGAKNSTGNQVVKMKVEGAPETNRLGGIGNALAEDLQPLIENEIRVTILGHIQRGGTPTAFDRNLATTFGVEAAKCIIDKDFGKMVAHKEGRIQRVDLKEAIGKQKLVEKDNQLVQAAREVGTSFGD